jgi:ketosteroid isomerase-like protein
MEDRFEIQGLLARYCHTIDDGDIDALMDLFDESATVTLAGKPYEGQERVRKLLSRIRGAQAVKHYCANINIDVDGDAANVVCDYLVTDVKGQALQAGRYQDDLVRVASGWHFTHRRIIPAA